MREIATTDNATVEAVINYVDPVSPIGAINDIEREKSTLRLIPHRMCIRDARPLRARLGLETNGFVWLAHPTGVTDFTDAKQVDEVYLPEVAALVKQLTHADKVVVFGHVQRDGALIASRHRPVFNAHVDYDEPTVRAIARRLLPDEEYGRRSDQRILLANVWRPIECVQSTPLAVCDAASVERQDLVFGPIGGKSAAGVPSASGWNLAYNVPGIAGTMCHGCCLTRYSCSSSAIPTRHGFSGLHIRPSKIQRALPMHRRVVVSRCGRWRSSVSDHPLSEARHDSTGCEHGQHFAAK